MSADEKSDGKQAQPSRMGAGVAIGVAVGTAIGVSMHNIGLGVGIGVALGVALGFDRHRTGLRNRLLLRGRPAKHLLQQRQCCQHLKESVLQLRLLLSVKPMQRCKKPTLIRTMGI
jgi:hypothetical protein